MWELQATLIFAMTIAVVMAAIRRQLRLAPLRREAALNALEARAEAAHAAMWAAREAHGADSAAYRAAEEAYEDALDAFYAQRWSE